MNSELERDKIEVVQKNDLKRKKEIDHYIKDFEENKDREAQI